MKNEVSVEEVVKEMIKEIPNRTQIPESVVYNELKKAENGTDDKVLFAFYFMSLYNCGIHNGLKNPNKGEISQEDIIKYNNFIPNSLEQRVRDTLSKSSCLVMDIHNGMDMEIINRLNPEILDGTTTNKTVHLLGDNGDKFHFVNDVLNRPETSISTYIKGKGFQNCLKPGYDFIVARNMFDWDGFCPDNTNNNQEEFVDHLSLSLKKLNPNGISVYMAGYEFNFQLECLMTPSEICKKHNASSVPKHLIQKSSILHKLGLNHPFSQDFEVVDYFNREWTGEPDCYKTVKMEKGEINNLLKPAKLGMIYAGSPGYVIIRRKSNENNS